MKITKKQLKKIIQEELKALKEDQFSPFANPNPDLPPVKGTRAVTRMGRREAGFDPIGYQGIEDPGIESASVQQDPDIPAEYHRKSMIDDLFNHQVELTEKTAALEEKLDRMIDDLKEQIGDLRVYVGEAVAKL